MQNVTHHVKVEKLVLPSLVSNCVNMLQITDKYNFLDLLERLDKKLERESRVECDQRRSSKVFGKTHNFEDVLLVSKPNHK